MGYYNDPAIVSEFWSVWQITLIVVLILVGGPSRGGEVAGVSTGVGPVGVWGGGALTLSMLLIQGGWEAHLRNASCFQHTTMPLLPPLPPAPPPDGWAGRAGRTPCTPAPMASPCAPPPLAGNVAQVGGPTWVWRIVQYMRKRAQQPMDIELVLYSVVAAADVFSFALCIVLLLVRVCACERVRGRAAALGPAALPPLCSRHLGAGLSGKGFPLRETGTGQRFC